MGSGRSFANFACGQAECLARTTLLFAVLLGASRAPAASQSVTSDEYRLKAAFVSHFPQFVEWPAPSIADRESLEICVATPNPFGSALQEIVAGDSWNGRPLLVREVDPDKSLDTCHVLYVSPTRASQARVLLERAALRPILTVGDAPGFLDDGGIIKLRIVDRRLRFEVNAPAAERVGLRLSSQLLRLALDVRGGER